LLSAATNIYVLADRGAPHPVRGWPPNLRKALPNACSSAFSGTPIDKKDRSIPRQLRPYIDTYTIEQPWPTARPCRFYYEGRLAEVRIVGNTLDAIFDRWFGRPDPRKSARPSKKKYAASRRSPARPSASSASA